MSTSLPPGAQLPAGKRRRRPKLSCVLCRRRKVKCNRELPCDQCYKLSKGRSCFYSDLIELPRPHSHRSVATTLESAGGARDPSSTTSGPSTAWTSPDSSQRAESESSRRQVCAQISNNSSAIPTDPSIGSSIVSVDQVARPADGNVIQPADNNDPALEFLGDGWMSEFHGYSHWAAAFTQLPCVVSALSNMSVMTETGMRESFWKYVSRQRTRKMYQFNETLLRLSIVSHECTKHDFTTREQTWLLTSKFMETFGTMFQILDFDELRQLHERMWLDHPLGCDAFALLALVFCIGNAFVPKESPHRLTQPVAYRWFETARGWRNSAIPVEKYNFQTLRVDILLYVARVLYGFGFPTDAVSSAMLVRNAMAMGLHRNRVTTARSAEEQQLRRNMWFTVLELDVQASLEAGLPPSCPDGSLREDVLPDLSDFPGRELLARSLSIRSRIADTLNRCDGDVSYEVVQDLHKELIKTVGGSLCRPQGTTVNDFVWNYAEIRLRRAFVALHWTFAVQDDTRFFFSRQVCLSMSSQILRHFLVNSDEDNYLRNLVRDQSTTFQNDAFPAALYLCYELLRGVSTPDVGNPLGRLSMLRQEAHELASRFVELAAGRVRESHYAELAYVTIATLSKYNQWGEQNGLEGDNEHTRAVLQNIADGVAQQCCELMAS